MYHVSRCIVLLTNNVVIDVSIWGNIIVKGVSDETCGSIDAGMLSHIQDLNDSYVILLNKRK